MTKSSINVSQKYSENGSFNQIFAVFEGMIQLTDEFADFQLALYYYSNVYQQPDRSFINQMTQNESFIRFFLLHFYSQFLLKTPLAVNSSFNIFTRIFLCELLL